MASIAFSPTGSAQFDGNSHGTIQSRKRKGMKRRNDVEKTVEPMFPRLHVNDKVKGGPRAPPRNKMALYEQLTIPSQRFNPRGLPPNTLPTSSIQGSGVVRDSLHLSSTDDHPDDKSHSRDERQEDEDDCSVPIYVQLRMRQNSMGGEKTTSAVSKSSSKVVQDERDGGQRHIYSIDMNSKDVMSARKENSKVTGEGTIRNVELPADQNEGGNIKFLENKVKSLQDQELEDYSGYSFTGLCETNNYVVESMVKQHENEAGIPRTTSHEEKCRNPKEQDDVCVKGNSPQEEGKIVKEDAVSEILVVDSISCSDISPDDVVGVIGQRRFWKARETIAKHQRVFAFQLFELHRLIMVQQLIASLPQLCVEDSFFLANSTAKVSSTAKHPTKCIAKSLHPIMNSEASKKLNDRKECSANNTSLPFAINRHHSGTAHPVPLAGERNMASWCFPQPLAHRWLIPVMSPSEGLVYKPCPEGYVPYGSMPLMGGFANPTQGNDVFPIKPLTEHHYTHPHSIPPTNHTISGSVGDQSSSCGRSGSNFQQSSVPTQTSSFVPSDASRGTELQARSRSHNSERDQSTGLDHTTEEREERDGPHLPVDEVFTHTNMQTHCTNLPNQVIKVVPRNPRSAVESAARIFQSIQEERKLQPR